ncbi:MarR family transcriptional regulator [Chloroflexi bacterium TSY]|nr:MarR family transcriptional regulator [Chloroflexi bacterium TSY]
MVEQFNAFLKPFGLTEKQFNVLRILSGQKGKPMNLFLIQERMMHKNSNVTRLVEKLRLKGLVERVPCEENRRKVEITITKAGLQLLEQIDAEFRKQDRGIHNKISKNEADIIAEALDKIRS